MSTTITNEKSPAAANDRAPITTTNGGNFEACPAFDQASPDKYRANVLARAALIGLSVHELADGSYLASWRGWMKPCPDLATVKHMVRDLGGAQ